MNLQITGVPLPVRMTFDKPLTEDELLQFSASNEVVWIEREPDGTLYVKPIWDTMSGFRIARINGALGNWSEQDGRGECCGGSGYLLPDGAMLGAPVSWILNERIATLTKAERKGYPRLAPDFIVEVRSAFDNPDHLPRKMDQWIANGVQVAWLIEAGEQRVTIYRNGQSPEVLQGPLVVLGDGVIAGFKLEMERIWEVAAIRPKSSSRLAP
jgi:Uma2 family endonuclease